MCGINGVFAYGDLAPPVDEVELLRTREHMLKRGPDGAGLWISPDRKVGLAHRRLAIIDLSESGAQPMVTADGRLIITFNGEIYNYRALRLELEAKGYVFRSQSDTEVLLHLYADRGAEMVHALRGMYAFALWDTRNRSLFLVRDPFGIKPLYFSDDGQSFRFASQVKALLSGGNIDTCEDPAGIVGFYLWGSVPEPYSLYRAIRALPAGCTLLIDLNGARKPSPFFSVASALAQSEWGAPTTNSVELGAELRAGLLDSVRRHLISDVPVGVFLSAGLDSTTLTALTAELSGKPHTVTLGFREFVGTSNDEVPLAEQVASMFSTCHTTVWVDQYDFQSQMDGLLDAMDQPTIDGVNSYFVSKAAYEANLKVALSGLGGDELFAGYSYFRQIPAMVNALAPFNRLPWVGRLFRRVSAPILNRFVSPKYSGVLEFGGSYSSSYLLRRGMFMPWELLDHLDGEIVREGWAELQTLARLEQSHVGIGNSRLKISALEMSWYMKNQLLRDTDWASMAHSVEVRVPLIDVSLLSVVANLVARNRAPSKIDFAHTPIQALPPRVMARSKTGFSVPVHDWLRATTASTDAQDYREWASFVIKSARGASGR